MLGGARSGKSRYAEEVAEAAARPVTYVATAGPPRDAEMAARIAGHRARRPGHWTTLEAPVDIAATTAGEGIVLIDCLTLWLTNIMLGDHDVAEARDRLCDALEARTRDVIAVANEVGEGIVPATPLGRAFRDEQGILNQAMARRATTVVKVVAGCPLQVKPAPIPAISL